MKFEYFVSRRYLKSRKEKHFISKLSIIGIIIVTISVMIPILTTSIINGFHDGILLKHQDKDFHIQMKVSSTFKEVDEALKFLNSIEEVKYAVPFYEDRAMIKYNQRHTNVLVRGLPSEILKYDQSFKKNFKSIAGTFNLSDNYRINVGEYLVDKLLIKKKNVENNKHNLLQVVILHNDQDYILEEDEDEFVDDEYDVEDEFDENEFDEDINVLKLPGTDRKKNDILKSNGDKRTSIDKELRKKFEYDEEGNLVIRDDLNLSEMSDKEINALYEELEKHYQEKIKEENRRRNENPALWERLEDSVVYYTFKVASIFSTGYMNYDKNIVFIPLKTAQSIFGSQDVISGLGVKLHNPKNVKKVEKLIKERYDNDPTVNSIVSWELLNAHLKYAFEWEKQLMTIVLFILIIASFLTIYINLNVVVMDKKSEIGILKSFGTTNRSIERIFIMEGFLIGTMGTLFGVILGILLTVSATDIVGFVQDSYNTVSNIIWQSPFHVLLGMETPPEGLDILSSSIMDDGRFPYNIEYNDILLIAFGAIFVSLKASFYPARKANLAKPVEVIRHEK